MQAHQPCSDPFTPEACASECHVSVHERNKKSLFLDVSPTASPTAPTKRMSRPFQDVAKPVLTLSDCIQLTPDHNGHHVIDAQQDESKLVPASDPGVLVVDVPSDHNASPNRTLNDDFNAKFTAPNLSEIDLNFAAQPPDAHGSCLTVAAAAPHKIKPEGEWRSVICSRQKPNKQSNTAKLTKFVSKASNQKAANTVNPSAARSTPAPTASKKRRARRRSVLLVSR